MAQIINIPQADFVTSILNGAVSAVATSFTIGTGLTLDANGGELQLDYDSAVAVGVNNGPETITYTAYDTTTGAVTGVTRGVAGTTGVIHANGCSVQCGATSLVSKRGNLLDKQIATTNQTPITAVVDLTSLTSTVTVPAGGRPIRITGYINVGSSVTADVAKLFIYEDATLLQYAKAVVGTSDDLTLQASVIITPTAAAHTYKLALKRNVGSGNLTSYATANNPAYISVELL